MKIYIYAYMALGLSVLAGCTNSVVSNDDEEENARRQYSYELMFEEMFGEIDPQHTWGFSSASSRADAIDTKAVGEYRILVEDLAARANYDLKSTASDWDFNDLVMDVKKYKKEELVSDEGTGDEIRYNLTYYCIDITIQALGGTLPIYIEYKTSATNIEKTSELHGWFNVPVTTMLNTGRASADPITVTIVKTTDQAFFESYDIKDIKVLVGETEIEMQAPVGKAPGKICVGTNIQWPAEQQCIKLKYDTFVEWVRDREATDWQFDYSLTATDIDLDVDNTDQVADWDNGSSNDVNIKADIEFNDSRAVDVGASVYWANVDAVTRGSIDDIDWDVWDGWQIPTLEQYQEIVSDGNWESGEIDGKRYMIYHASNGSDLSFVLFNQYATATKYSDDYIYVFNPRMSINGEWDYRELSTSSYLTIRLVHVK